MWLIGPLVAVAALTPAEREVIEWLKAGFRAEERAWDAVEIEYQARADVSREWFMTDPHGEFKQHLDLGKGRYLQRDGLSLLHRTDGVENVGIHAFDGDLYRVWQPASLTGSLTWLNEQDRVSSPRVFLGAFPDLPSVPEMLDAADRVVAGDAELEVHTRDPHGFSVSLHYRTESSFVPLRVRVSIENQLVKEHWFEQRDAYPREGASLRYVARGWYRAEHGLARTSDEIIEGTITRFLHAADLTPAMCRIPAGFTVFDKRFGRLAVVGTSESEVVRSQAGQLAEFRLRQPRTPQPRESGLPWGAAGLFLGSMLVAYGILAGAVRTLRARSGRQSGAAALLAAAVGMLAPDTRASAQEETRPFASIVDRARQENSCAYWTLQAWATVEDAPLSEDAIAREGPHTLAQVSDAVRTAGRDAQWVTLRDERVLLDARHAFLAFAPGSGRDRPGHFAVAVVAAPHERRASDDVLLLDYPEPARRLSLEAFRRKFPGPVLLTGADVSLASEAEGRTQPWVLIGLGGAFGALAAGFSVRRSR